MNELSVYQLELIVNSEVETSGSLNDLMQKAKQEYDLSLGAFKRSVEHIWHMGKLLTEAQVKHRVLKKKKGKDQPNWEDLLDKFGISVASDYRAKRVYKNFPVLEKISGLSITEAYEAAGIPRSESKPNTPVSSSLEANGEAEVDSDATNSGNDLGDADELDEEMSDDDFDSTEDDLVDNRTYVDMLLDTSANMEALLDRTEPLSDEEIKVVLAEVELILKYALEIKMRLEEAIGTAA